MKIRDRMILIFSVMMLAAASILTSYTVRSFLETTEAFRDDLFVNMGETMVRAIEQEISMMDLTMEELIDDTSFMAALNQFVRDDSADRKMANAASNAVLQQLYRSPMVNNFYRVSFYSRDGDFVTSRIQKDDYLESGTDQARSAIGKLPWLDDVDARPQLWHILTPHNDFLSVRRDIAVYGVVRAVLFHGRMIGYMEISNELDNLTDILGMVDEPNILARAVFDDGEVLYAGDSDAPRFPLDMPVGRLTTYAEEDGSRFSVMRVRSEWLGLNLFIYQDHSIIDLYNRSTVMGNVRTTVAIMIPTLALIIFFSIRLAHSATLLTRKVRQLRVEQVLKNDPAAAAALSSTVSSPHDKEIYELEQVFNVMMRHLQESAMREMSMREGTLQARFNALQTQINPHFIYNTLNIISAKSMESGNLEIIEICDQFAQLLRYATDTRSRTATLAEEIENVRNYLLLAKARYEENLEFSIDVPKLLGYIKVPRLTLQPLVENALTHGFDGKNSRRRLGVVGFVEDKCLILEIRDDGTGFTPDMLRKLQEQLREIDEGRLTMEKTGGHIGLVNTCLRLHYYSRGAMRVTIRNENGAVVRLTMPIDPVEHPAG